MTNRSTGLMYETIDSLGDGVGGSTGLVLQDTYTLGALIGKGGMGEVYEATHMRLPGLVAVKVLRPHLLRNEDAFARFCREAEIMSTFRHPHIVQIFDFNTAVDGLPYFVMERLEGVDLATRLVESGALPLKAVLSIVDAVASALDAAHAMGVVHRDLKPANIFLMRGRGQEGDFVKVLDFGISTTTRGGPRSSTGSDVMGTPEFMAPEQALGLVIDARTDQFALAAITYAMLTGSEPFVGDDLASVLYQVVHEQPLPLSHFLSGDTGELQTVLDRALVKRQHRRFASIGEFAAALRAAAHCRIRSSMHGTLVPRLSVAVAAASDAAEPPVEQLRRKSTTIRPVEISGQVDLPRRIDRIPRGPQRIVVAGLAMLGLAAVIVHHGGWRRGLPERLAGLERNLVGQVQAKWRTSRSGVTVSSPEGTALATGPRKLSLTPGPRQPAEAVRLPGEPAANVVAVGGETPRPSAARSAHHHTSVFRSRWPTIELLSQAPSTPTEPSAVPAARDSLPSTTPPPLVVAPEVY